MLVCLTTRLEKQLLRLSLAENPCTAEPMLRFVAVLFAPISDASSFNSVSGKMKYVGCFDKEMEGKWCSCVVRKIYRLELLYECRENGSAIEDCT